MRQEEATIPLPREATKVAQNERSLLLVTTGGTIDKEYPKTIGGYAFEIGSPAALKILARIGHNMKIDVVESTKKDSLDITESDRRLIAQAIADSRHQRVLITHGTSTMIETAAALHDLALDQEKTIVITGAFKPECMVHSDASFNVGVALAGALSLPAGVFIAMQGQLFPWNRVQQDTKTGFFVSKL
ncbi:putative L-asparaginase [Diplonema papillatum]|nr:putative L-asparaginase [Diplonema papillatum]